MFTKASKYLISTQIRLIYAIIALYNFIVDNEELNAEDLTAKKASLIKSNSSSVELPFLKNFKNKTTKEINIKRN